MERGATTKLRRPSKANLEGAAATQPAAEGRQPGRAPRSCLGVAGWLFGFGASCFGFGFACGAPAFAAGLGAGALAGFAGRAGGLAGRAAGA